MLKFSRLSTKDYISNKKANVAYALVCFLNI